MNMIAVTVDQANVTHIRSSVEKRVKKYSRNIRQKTNLFIGQTFKDMETLVYVLLPAASPFRFSFSLGRR